MPKCVLRRAETMPTPNSRAISMASAMRLGCDHEAEGVLAVERADHRRDALDLEIRPRIDQATPHAFEIVRQRLQPVGIDAAQVGVHQTARDRRRVFLRQIMRDQKPAAKGFGRFGVDIERACRRVRACRLC